MNVSNHYSKKHDARHSCTFAKAFLLLLLLYSFHPIAEITLKNANIKDEFKGASTRIN